MIYTAMLAPTKVQRGYTDRFEFCVARRPGARPRVEGDGAEEVVRAQADGECECKVYERVGLGFYSSGMG